MKLTRITQLATGLLLALIGAFSALDLVRLAVSPATYTFGTEVAGWKYYSVAHFVAESIASLLLSAAGLFLPPILKLEPASALWLRVVVLFVLLLSLWVV